MKLSLGLILGIISIYFISCSSMIDINSHLPDKPIKIDGNSEEWTIFNYIDKEPVILAVRNDKENLYLCLKTNDLMTIKKIVDLGLTVWINKNSDKSKSFGIHYPVGMIDKMKFNSNKKDNSESDKKYELIPNELEFKFDEEKNIIFSSVTEAQSKYKISVALKETEETLTYELCIPFNPEFKEFSISPDKTKSIGLGFETPEPNKNENKSRIPRGDGMPDGGSGGFPGGGSVPGLEGGGMSRGGGGGRSGMGGGGRSGSRRNQSGSQSSDRKSMMEPLQLWFEVKLAK